MDFIWNVVLFMIGLVIGIFGFYNIIGSFRTSQFRFAIIAALFWLIILGGVSWGAYAWAEDYLLAYGIGLAIAFLSSLRAGTTKQDLQEIRNNPTNRIQTSALTEEEITQQMRERYMDIYIKEFCQMRGFASMDEIIDQEIHDEDMKRLTVREKANAVARFFGFSDFWGMFEEAERQHNS